MSRVADHAIEEQFVRRWSPRAMSGAPIGLAELMRVFEAARWAPSAGNSQPWRFVYAIAQTPDFDAFLELLDPGNREWCVRAGALLLVTARTVSEQGRPLASHAFDAGAAWMSLALQGTAMGLVVHAMAGFDAGRARERCKVPVDHAVLCMVAVGHPGRVEDLPERLRPREAPTPRQPLADRVFEGRVPGG
jgi:nitroreductase